jgi:hypothetical protein
MKPKAAGNNRFKENRKKKEKHKLKKKIKQPKQGIRICNRLVKPQKTDSFKKTQQPKQNPESKSRNLIYRKKIYNEDIAVDL